MQLLIILVLAFHVLPGVFWAGTTFTLARTGGPATEGLLKSQMGAATVAVLTGIAMWGFLHRGRFGHPEQVLAFGILCAIVAAGVQGSGARAARREATDTARSARIAKAQRLAAPLLAVTVICMAIARYV